MSRAGGSNRSERPDAVPANALPYLEEAPSKVKSAAARAKGAKDEAATLVLVVRNLRAAADGLREGDLLTVSNEADPEPGDLVVWWTGSRRSMALARMQPNLTLAPVAGFPPPPQAGGRAPRVRGTVIARERPR